MTESRYTVVFLEEIMIGLLPRVFPRDNLRSKFDNSIIIKFADDVYITLALYSQ